MPSSADLVCVVLAMDSALPADAGVAASEQPPGGAVSLEILRRKVLVNEAKASLIRMEFKLLSGAEAMP